LKKKGEVGVVDGERWTEGGREKVKSRIQREVFFKVNVLELRACDAM